MKVYKVFTINSSEVTYCYSKDEAMKTKRIWKQIGITKVCIKGRRL